MSATEMLGSLEDVTFDKIVSIEEGESIFGDKEIFVSNLEMYAQNFESIV
jgi:hypothetical protein